eukprot:7335890-Pyramimonas_sp.AAC.2
MGAVKILWKLSEYLTKLTVTENKNDKRITFELIESDALDKFNGDWQISRGVNSNGKVITLSHLGQDCATGLYLKGMPPWLSNVPLLGGIFRGISVRAITRLINDIQVSIGHVLRPRTMLCDERSV